MTNYILSSNASFGAIDPIPIETANRLRHASNNGEAATKVLDLNIVLSAAGTGVPATIESTVARTPSGLLIHVIGWTTTAAQYTNLLFTGGVPPGSVAPTIGTSPILSYGTIQVINGVTSPVMPSVYLLSGDVEFTTSDWTFALPSITYAGNNSYLRFDFSFYL